MYFNMIHYVKNVKLFAASVFLVYSSVPQGFPMFAILSLKDYKRSNV